MLKRLLFIFFMVCSFSVYPQGADAPEGGQEEPGLGKKILWYLPNRAMDLLDIFRFRVKAGPGLGVGARFTEAVSFYFGREHTVYAGLPGPRDARRFPPLLGFEQRRGMVVLGVDASDTLSHPPRYEYSEIGASAHVGLLGASAGFSVVELRDFLSGWFGQDYSNDDFPKRGSQGYLGPGSVLPPLNLDTRSLIEPKPYVFSCIHTRLDYLYRNGPFVLQRRLRLLDVSLTDDVHVVKEQPPVTDLSVALFYQFITGPDGNMTIDPDIKLDVELPNFENRMSLFIQSTYNDDLPSTNIADRDDKGWSVGVSRRMDDWNIDTEIGLHTKWEPELFVRMAWKPRWKWEEWHMGFENRLFWENEDGFGIYHSLQALRWLGDRNRWVFRSLTAGRISEVTQGYEWQHTLNLGYINRLKREKYRGRKLEMHNILQGAGLDLTMVRKDEAMHKYRAIMLYRRNIYRDFVVLQLEPGLEWQNEHDWTTQYRIDAGIILLF